MIRWEKEWQGTYHINLLVMDESVAKRLIEPLKRELANTRRLYEKYRDIQEGGDATRRQQTMMVKYKDKMTDLETIINVIEPQFNTKGGAS